MTQRHLRNRNVILGSLLLLSLFLLNMTACSDKKSETTPGGTESATTMGGDTGQKSDAMAGSPQAEAQPMDAAPATTDMSTSMSPEQTGAAGEMAPATTEPGMAVAEGPELALARTSGCLTCHLVDKKIVGPAWKDVAVRYAGNPAAKAMLIEKVSKGGSGNWTSVVGNVVMPPNSPKVSAQDIEILVDYILAL